VGEYENLGDLSTLADISVVEKIIAAHRGARLGELSTEGLAASHRPLILECPHRDLQHATPPMVFRFRRRVST
jgi:hypothetical protein